MSSDTKIPVRWSSQLSVLPVTQPVPLRGDKIILPPSTLEQLLSASTVTLPSTNQPQTSTFDAYNPYSYAAEQQARAQLFERQQELPHPLTFRLVNPLNGRVCYAGVREFSADEGFVGLSPFLSHSLGFDESQDKEPPRALPNGNDTHRPPYPSESKLTVHFETLPKGTYVRLRPLEAGYDPEDWKALLEKHLRDNFTTLTNGEIMTVASGREEYRFLVDGLRPNEKAIILVDTDLEVDIEPLNEEQARETLKRRALKAQRAPGTADGSSPGGLVSLGQIVAGQVRSGDYVDYTIEEWDRRIDLELELSPANDEQDIDLLVTPAGPKQCARPREDEHVFADFSPSPSKRIKIKHTNAELDNSDALWISVRGYSHENSSTQKTAPIPYSLCITSTASSTAPSVDGPDTPIPTATAPSLDEDICSNCHQSVPRQIVSRMEESLALLPRFLPRHLTFLPAKAQSPLPYIPNMSVLCPPLQQHARTSPSPHNNLPRKTHPLSILPSTRSPTRTRRPRTHRPRSPAVGPHAPRTHRRSKNNRMPPLLQDHPSPRHVHPSQTPRLRTFISHETRHLPKQLLWPHARGIFQLGRETHQSRWRRP
ncbi:MAG: hypothetical protein L6R40_000785 [Gallowayella cf. fulva]|nr:MAG: hypothetical protein L6R40_000785 [Xanthomendoza cf. fulva]